MKAQNKADLDNSTPLVKAKTESPVKVVGDFSNVKGDGEHQWGYSVALWRQEDKILGLFSGSDDLRLIGDPPTGILENVRFDSKTGKLCFLAKLPEQHIYEFEGILTSKELSGKIKITNELCSDKCPKTQKITLHLSKDMTLTMEEYQSYSEWKAVAEKILELRGPKS